MPSYSCVFTQSESFADLPVLMDVLLPADDGSIAPFAVCRTLKEHFSFTFVYLSSFLLFYDSITCRSYMFIFICENVIPMWGIVNTDELKVEWAVHKHITGNPSLKNTKIM